MPSLDKDGLTIATVDWHRPDRSLINVTRTVDGHHIDQFLAQTHMHRDLTDEQLNEEYEAWVRRRLEIDPPPPTRCEGCGAVLVPVFQRDTDVQFENALRVVFRGGYGMYIDPMMGGPDPAALICKNCADELCEAFPWIKADLRPEYEL